MFHNDDRLAAVETVHNFPRSFSDVHIAAGTFLIRTANEIEGVIDEQGFFGD